MLTKGRSEEDLERYNIDLHENYKISCFQKNLHDNYKISCFQKNKHKEHARLQY